MILSVAEKIRIIMNRNNISMGELAEATGQSRPNLSNKMTRNNFNESDIRKMAEALGCKVEIKFITKNGEEI